MKIGVLTFHRSINYGAVTQCYAMVTELKKRFPDDTVEVIDYVPQFRMERYEPTLLRYLFGAVSARNTAAINAKIVASKMLSLIQDPDQFRWIKTRYSAFKASMACLPLSETAYRQNDAELFRREVYGKYDVIVVGSDCVWEWTTVPLPSAYYLHGDYGAKKVSFAASAGTDDAEKLTPGEKKLVSQALKEFSYIGVRDSSTEYVVQKLYPEAEIFHCCDPTTFLDTASLEPYRQRAKEKLRKAGITFDKPIAGVMSKEKIGQLAREALGDSVQYVGLYSKNRYCDVNLLNLEVLEWAAVFSLFDITFTNFFHGTMLSLANQTPVLSFDYLPETDRQHTKLHELYDRLALPDFYHREKAVYTTEDVDEIRAVAHRLMANPPSAQIRDELKKEALYCEGFFHCLASLHE